jgi:hypothetical protein
MRAHASYSLSNFAPVGTYGRQREVPITRGIGPVIREILCDIGLDWLRTVAERPAQNAVEF